MDIIRTNSYYKIELHPKQYQYISSNLRINDALKLSECIAFNALKNNQIIGFALLHAFKPGHYFLWNFIVDRNFQGEGNGKAFLQSLIDILKVEYHAEAITTTYTDDNDVAQNFYQSFGFTVVDVVDVKGKKEINMVLPL